MRVCSLHDGCMSALQVRPQRGRLAGRSIIATGEPKETIFTSTAAGRKPCSSLVRTAVSRSDLPHDMGVTT